MCRLRAFVALLWFVATAALASVPPTPASEPAGERPSQALLSEPPISGSVGAARTRPSPNPIQDAQGVALVAIPVVLRLPAGTRPVEDGPFTAGQLSTRPHPQRGPPAPA